LYYKHSHVLPLAIQAMGAFTSAGVSVAQTMGSVRLSVQLFEELPTISRGQPVVGARSALAIEKTTGLDRLVAMAGFALAECGTDVESERLPLLLCLPREEDSLYEASHVLRATIEQSPVALDAKPSRAFAAGRAGIVEAVVEAERLLSSGACASCYVGGVDSLVDHDMLDRLLRTGCVKTATAEGYVPGEGAVFLRLAARPDRGTLGIVAGVAAADEQTSNGAEGPNPGAGLTRAARTALAQAGIGMPLVGLMVHGAAGDRAEFRETGIALLRLRPRADPTPGIWTPAVATGELRAAYGPLAVALATHFLGKKVNAGPAGLVLLSGERTHRGAMVILEPGSPSTGRRR
jgi:3-oxoacyl-[acyl-carrier-protein] synthase-1